MAYIATDVIPDGSVTTAKLSTNLLVTHAAGSASTPTLTFQGNTTNGLFSPGTDTLAITTASTERLRVDSSGRLLVGTSTARSNFFNGAYTALFQVESASNLSRIASVISSTSGVEGAILALGHQRSGAVGGNTIVASGDEIGIVNFVGSDGTNFVQAALIKAEVDGTPGTNDMPGRLVFSTTADGAASPTERVRITSNGNALINTSNESGKLCVAAAIPSQAGNRIALFSGIATGDGGYEAIGISKFDNNSTTAQIFQRFYINNGAIGCGQINANGASSAAFGTYSDSRLKENIEDLPPQLQNICSLRPVEFDYKDGSGHQIGFIAQEMENIYPDAVAENSDGMLTITGWSKTEARLVKALQEAITKIETLESDNANFKEILGLK